MKANEVPERIYLQVCGDCSDDDCKNCKFENLESSVTWCKDRIFANDIEYARTDDFIKKACEWLKKSITNNPETNRIISLNGTVTMGMLIEDFRNYMKGE